jgi:hypothetical protein
MTGKTEITMIGNIRAKIWTAEVKIYAALKM